MTRAAGEIGCDAREQPAAADGYEHGVQIADLLAEF